MVVFPARRQYLFTLLFWLRSIPVPSGMILLGNTRVIEDAGLCGNSSKINKLGSLKQRSLLLLRGSQGRHVAG